MTHKEIDIMDVEHYRLTKNYYILMCLCYNIPIPEKRYVSFYLLPDSRCTEKKHIPYCSRNFLSVHMTKKDIESGKEFLDRIGLEPKVDYLYVGRCSDDKKTIDVLNWFNGCGKKCLILILKQDMNCHYYKKFKAMKVFDNVKILDTHVLENTNKYFWGFNHEELSYIYNTGKIYFHASEEEGDSRSIQEALACGCFVMAKRNMKGGGIDYLNDRNSVLYDSGDVFARMNEAQKKSSSYVYDESILEKVNERYTIPKFAKLLNDRLYNGKLEDMKLNSKHLSLSLPSHDRTVKWYEAGKLTADIKNRKQFEIFMSCLK